METKNKDKLLKDFFSSYKQEIADNGFTARVMQRLPEQTYRGWIVWIFAAIGMAITFYIGLQSGFVDQLLVLLKHVPVYYIVGGVFCFPLVGTAGFYFSQTRDYHLI
jgi:hypothetical protein